VIGDGVAEPHEGLDARTPSPLQPLLEEFDRLHEGELEDKAEVLLQLKEARGDIRPPAAARSALRISELLGYLDPARPVG